LLEDWRADVADRLRSLRTTLPEESAPVKDVEEAGVEDVTRDLQVALAEMGSMTLRHIEDALKRLGEGTYGTCDRCNKPIAEARLRALPFAALCRACQQREERESVPQPRRPETPGGLWRREERPEPGGAIVERPHR
jgi:DnaK suppressor protein